VSPVQVVAAIGEADGTAVVLAQGELPPEAVAAAMAGGRAAGAVTVLNPAPAYAFSQDVLANVDYLIPNEHEAALLTGRPTQTLDDARAAAVYLVGLGVTCAIVTRGSQGLVWATADGSGAMSAFTVDAIDTVAAGDAFCGAFAAALAEGHDLQQALLWASAAGALATTVAGAVPSLPTRESVQVLLDA
jgi:ribokinase